MIFKHIRKSGKNSLSDISRFYKTILVYLVFFFGHPEIIDHKQSILPTNDLTILDR